MSGAFLGQLALYPYWFAPLHWIECSGQLLPIAQYTALFSLLGVKYGGDGTTNFALPDLRGRVAVGSGTSPTGSAYSIGRFGGVETVTVATPTLPRHSHTLNATTAAGTTNAPAGMLLGAALSGEGRKPNEGNIYASGTPATALAPASLLPAGDGLPHNNIQPSLGLRYCICLDGIFPQRG